MKPINESAPVKCTKSVFIDASPERVWRVLTDIDRWSKWQTDISFSKQNGGLQAGETFTWKTGGVKISSVIHTAELNSQFGWTGKTIGVSAIHNWILEPHEAGTNVTVAESLEGWLASLLKGVFNKNLEKGMSRWLNLLKTECEKSS